MVLHGCRVEAMRALLDANANPNVISDDGASPMFEIFAHPGMRHSEDKLRTMFALLRDAGAEVDRLLPHQARCSALLVCGSQLHSVSCCCQSRNRCKS